jgi:ABC-2 type transport system ATP-binding protein
LETTVSREVLQRLLDPCGLQKLSFNGGVYLLYFKPGTSTAQLLTLLGNAALPVNYLRDISLSSRRFFDA